MKRKITILLIAISLTFNINNAKAVEDTINNNEEQNTSTFIAGNTINNEKNTNGISIIAGNSINLKGKTSYGIYAGNSINVNEQVENDLIIAGNNIKINKTATIGRTLYIAGNNITINTNIEKDINIAGNTVNIKNITIKGNANIIANKIILDEETTIIGKLTYPKDTTIIGLNTTNIGTIKTTKTNRNILREKNIESITQFITSMISSFLVMILLFFILPNTKEKLDSLQLTGKQIGKDICLGATILIIVPIVSILTLFTIIFTPISIITLCIYAISIYLSSLIVSYIIGKNITKKLLKKENQYISLLLGIFTIKVINLLPTISEVFRTIILLYGMGLIYHYIRKK